MVAHCGFTLHFRELMRHSIFSYTSWQFVFLLPWNASLYILVTFLLGFFVVIQSLSHVWLFATPWTAAHQASLSFRAPGACSNSCPLSWWCHPTILSSGIPFSSCLQSFLASGSFLMSQLFSSGGQNIVASASVLPMNIQG